MTSRPRRRRATVRIAHGAAIVVGVLVGVLVVLAVLAPLVVRGARFGRVVGWVLPETRGTITVGGGRWSWGAVWALVRGQPAALWVENVRVTDPEGIEVLRLGVATGSVQLTTDHAHLVIRDLRLTDAAWRFAQMHHARDVGFLAAFQPVRKARARTPARAARMTSFAIASATLDGLDATFDFPAWGLALTNVYAHGALAVTAPTGSATGGSGAIGATTSPAPTFTFEVSDADLRGGGALRVLADRARVELPFASGRIARVATTAQRPDALQIEAIAIATGRSRMALSGSFTGLYGGAPPRTPGGPPPRASGAIQLRARFTDAADAVQAMVSPLLARRAPARTVIVGGGDATLALTASGPFDRLTFAADARGFDVRHRDLTFLRAGFALSVDVAALRARLDGLTFASPAGGRLTFDAAVEGRRIQGALTLDHFATTPYLPTFLRPLAGGVLDGQIKAQVDLAERSAAVDQLALTLDRPGSARGPRRVRLESRADTASGATARRGETMSVAGARFVKGTLILPAISLPIAGGRVRARGQLVLTDAAGKLRLPIVDLTADARGIVFQRLVGSTFVSGTLDFRTRVSGPLDDLSITLAVPPRETLRVFGEPCTLPASTVAHLVDERLSLSDFRLRGAHGAALGVAGSIDLSGALALTLTVRDFPLGKLPAMAEADLPFAGKVSGQLDVRGVPRAPILRGRVVIEDARFQGRPLGGGTLIITPGARGAIAAQGQVIDGVTVEGNLRSLGDGLHGAATMRLDAVRLDPFVASLLTGAGADVTGTVTGSLEAQVAPGQPPSIEGRLSLVALAVRLQAARAKGARADTRAAASEPHPIALQSQGEVRFSARAGGGPIQLQPARFVSDAGSLALQGQAERGHAQASARGRITLGALAPLLPSWLDRPGGALDFDLAATIAHARAQPIVTGSVDVATPVTFNVRGLPVALPVGIGAASGHGSGQIRLDPDRTAHLDLPLTLGPSRLRLTGTVTSPGAGEPRLVLALAVAGSLDAQLLSLAAPAALAWSRGSAAVEAHLDGRLEPGGVYPTWRARLRPGSITLGLRALPSDPIQIARGQIDVDAGGVTLSGIDVDVGTRSQVTIGAAGDGAATIQLGSLSHPRPGRIVLPVRGRITATSVPPVVIDDARFALRLDGDLQRRARLTGQVTLVGAHVPATRSSRPTSAIPGTASSASRWLTRPELARIDLDVQARSHGGAITVEVPKLPDVRVDVDYHLGGTLIKPQPSGRLEGANAYSSFALLLRRMFQ